MKLLGLVALIVSIIAVSVSVAATERVDLSLVLSGAAGWCFVPLVQLVTGLVLLRGTPATANRRQLLAALVQYFETHWPWSLWVLGMSLVLATIPGSRDLGSWLLVSALFPVYLTAKLLARLCRERLGMSAPVARKRVARHQAITMVVLFGTGALAVALWPRVVGLFD